MSATTRAMLFGIAAVAVTAALVALVIIQAGDGRCDDPTLSIAGGGAELHETTDGLEVVVSAEEGFTVGALVWILRIGRLEFDRSYHPEGVLTELAFPIPAAAVPLLEDGDGIAVRYGNPDGSGGDEFTRTDLDVDRAAGFASLRVSGGC